MGPGTNQDCRLCYNLCPSFNTLLDGIDDAMEGRDEAGEISTLLSRSTIGQVVDECFQCKLCESNCPYTPSHRWELDFPRLMFRANAARVAEKDMPLVDRVFGNPDRLGKVACKTPKLANWANGNAIFRAVMGKTIGIHRDRNLPEYARRASSAGLPNVRRAPRPRMAKTGRLRSSSPAASTSTRPMSARPTSRCWSKTVFPSPVRPSSAAACRRWTEATSKARAGA